MKRLLLLWLFSGSLDGFSQADTGKIDLKAQGWKVTSASDGPHLLSSRTVTWLTPVATTDTLRATLIVYYDSGPAILHTKPGFVVRQFAKEEIYLDDKKKVIKAPLEVLTYKLKNHKQ
jgi:hypothetical protein